MPCKLMLARHSFFALRHRRGRKRRKTMFKTKLDELGFTLLTSGLMIYIMGVYNVALHTGGLQYATFGMAAHSFPLE